MSDRCEILFEDLIINEGPHKKGMNYKNQTNEQKYPTKQNPNSHPNSLQRPVNFGCWGKFCWYTEVSVWLEQYNKQMAQFLFVSLDFFLNLENFNQVQICSLAPWLSRQLCIQIS